MAIAICPWLWTCQTAIVKLETLKREYNIGSFLNTRQYRRQSANAEFGTLTVQKLPPTSVFKEFKECIYLQEVLKTHESAFFNFKGF